MGSDALIAIRLEQIRRIREKNPRQALFLCEQILHVLSKQRGTSLWLRAQMTYAQCLLYCGRIEDVLRVCSQSKGAIEQLDSTGNPLRCMLYATLSYCLAFTGQFEGALEYAQRLLNLSQRMSDPHHECRAWLTMGTVHGMIEYYPVALACFTQALSLAEKLGDVIVQATALDNMGIVYEALGLVPHALENYHRAYELRSTIGSTPALAQTLLNMAVAHCRLGQYSQALKLARQGRDYAQQTGEIRVEAQCMAIMGWTYAELGKALRAIQCAQKSLEIQRKISASSPSNVTALSALINAQLLLKQEKAAQATLIELMKLAEQRDQPSVALQCTDTLYRISKDAGDTSQALYWSEQRHHWLSLAVQRHQQEQSTRQALQELVTRLTQENAAYQQQLAEMKQVIEQQRGEIARLTLAAASHRRGAVQKHGNPNSINGISNEIAFEIEQATSPSEIELLLKKVDWIIPGFVQALRAQVAGLTPMEVLICTLLRMQLRSKEIAQLLNVSLSTVNHHREHIRHKCKLQRRESLVLFLCSLG